MDKNQIAVNVFDKLANLYQEKYMDTTQYHVTFDLFCAAVKQQNADVLEVACGPGNITQYLLKKRPDFKILGTDLAPNMVRLAAQNNPEAEFQILDCRNIADLGKQYDAIVCGFCLPYISKEESVQWIKDAAQILKPNGVLYISTMEDDYNKSGMQTGSTGDQLYMYFHEADYLLEALTENGLRLLDLQRIANGYTISDLVVVATKSA